MSLLNIIASSSSRIIHPIFSEMEKVSLHKRSEHPILIDHFYLQTSSSLAYFSNMHVHEGMFTALSSLNHQYKCNFLLNVKHFLSY